MKYNIFSDCDRFVELYFPKEIEEEYNDIYWLTSKKEISIWPYYGMLNPDYRGIFWQPMQTNLKFPFKFKNRKVVLYDSRKEPI